eukprot:3844285-Amphidinium_carterae.2
MHQERKNTPHNITTATLYETPNPKDHASDNMLRSLVFARSEDAFLSNGCPLQSPLALKPIEQLEQGHRQRTLEIQLYLQQDGIKGTMRAFVTSYEK